MMSRLKKILKNFQAKWVLILICALVIAATYTVLYQHYLNPLVSIESDMVYRLESKLLDLKFRQRGTEKPTGKIGILAIDEKSITEFGEWPFSRKYYGQALRNLKDLGVEVISFDAIYAEPQETRLSDIKDDLSGLSSGWSSSKSSLERWMHQSPGDMDFAAAVGELSKIVLGFFYLETKQQAANDLGEDESQYFLGFDVIANSAVPYDMPAGRTLESYPLLRKPEAIKSNFVELNNAGQHFAFFSNNSDDDAINRWVTLLANINGELIPSLGLKTAAEHLDADILVFFDDVGVESIDLIDRDTGEGVAHIITDPYGAGRLLVNHRGGAHGFEHYSLADAYFGRYTDKQKEELKGMSLMVGGTATGTQDLRPNVFDPGIDGVENHAAVADNILRDDFLRRDRKVYQSELLRSSMIGLMFAPLMIWGSPIVAGFALIVFLVGFWYVDTLFWFPRGEWAYVAVPSLQIVFMFIITTFYKYFTEERERKKVKGAFQHYLSPDVIEQVLDDPDQLALGGKREEITVFFSDVRSFTSISESLTPEKLSEFMNIYFTPMTKIILDSKGTLDKYIGDAIMAFWGAPLHMPNHADLAAQACIDMLFALDELQENMPKLGFPKPDIGIGLNTGVASVGNMGSDARFSYTAMGDSINLGARLEGLTKDYGIKIMISEFTAAKLSKEKFHVRDLDDIRVKGKNEPVKVFELMRPDFLADAEKIKEFIEIFHEARKMYLAKNWEKAEQLFRDLQKIKESDGPSKLYLARIAEYKEESPGDDWDGVYTFKHK
jgi:adenylate cyclase